jgi:hypothetical protein
MQLPREAGTPAAQEARRLITEFLEARGYRVQIQRFSFLPSSINALPVVGAGLGWLTLLQVPLLLWPDTHPYAALGTWGVGAAALAIVGWGIGTGVPVPGAEHRDDANLIVTRGEGPTGRWIVAHVDTKAQGHSMAGRILAVWLLLAAIVGLTILAAARTQTTALPMTAVVGVAGLALVGGALAARGRLKGTTPGARDNGTGLLAALTVAAGSQDPGLGFLFTGAEEFGLVGARIVGQGGVVRAEAEVINLDTLDQQGDLYVVYHDANGARLADRIQPALQGLGPPVFKRRLPLGILTDSLPFARRGIAAVTIGRLDRATLRLIHTPGDRPEGLDLATAEGVGRALLGLGGAVGNDVDQGDGGA